MSLSDSLVYVPKPSAVSGHKFRVNQPTYNKSTFNPGEVALLTIPCGRKGHYLNTRMSYLKFRLNNTSLAADTIACDYSASSLISRLDIFHGSNLLESISEYNTLFNLWLDMTGSAEAHQHTGNILEGIDPSTERTGESIAGQASRVFCVPILSGIIGTLQSKYLPVGDMNAGDLRIELTFANVADGVVKTGASAGARSWSVSDVELMCEFVELNSEAAKMISAQNAGGYVISFDSFQTYSSTVEQGATNMNVLIPARVSSLKTLFTVVRAQDTIGNVSSKTISSRTNPFQNSGEYYYSISGKNIPSTPVKTDAEAFAELSKSLHAFGTVEATSMITKSNWENADGTYIISADTETLAHKSKVTESGINTLSANTYLIGKFTGALGKAVRLDTFVHMDGILLVQNGLCSTQF